MGSSGPVDGRARRRRRGHRPRCYGLPRDRDTARIHGPPARPVRVVGVRAVRGPAPIGSGEGPAVRCAAVDPILARKLARTSNPYPAIVFLAPEMAGAYTAAGLPQGRMGYFAGRSAPMGPVNAEVVIATFYSFAPHLVRRYIPEAWSLTTPSRLLEERLVAVDAALRRVLGTSRDRKSTRLNSSH